MPCGAIVAFWSESVSAVCGIVDLAAYITAQDIPGGTASVGDLQRRLFDLCAVIRLDLDGDRAARIVRRDDLDRNAQIVAEL